MSILLNSIKSVIFALYGLYVWLIFVVCSLIVVFLLMIVPGLNARRSLTRRGAMFALTLCGIRPKARGMENLPDEACVLVANHASYFDGIVMTALLPPQFQYVVKHEMTAVPIAGYLLKRIGTQFVRRGHASSRSGDARRIMKSARNKQSTVFFPEGTFSAEPGLKRFRNGAFATAASSGMPTVPAVIHGTRHILPAKKWLARPGSIDVVIKPPHRVGIDAKDAEQLKFLCRQSILADLNEPDTLAG